MVRKKPKEKKFLDIKANDDIQAEFVFAINSDGSNLGKLKLSEAISIADAQDLDLIQVSPIDNNSTCTAIIQSLSKYRYERLKKLKKTGSTIASQQKEWWFNSSIQSRDIQVKVDKIREYLTKGGVAKIIVKGAKKVLKESLYVTLDNIKTCYSEFAREIGPIIDEGKNLSILVKLKK